MTNERRNDEKILLKLQKAENNYDKIETKLDNILEYNARQDKAIKDIHLSIHGNGNPENGLATKHSRLDEKVSWLITNIKIHWGLLSAILIGALILLLRVL